MKDVACELAVASDALRREERGHPSGGLFFLMGKFVMLRFVLSLGLVLAATVAPQSAFAQMRTSTDAAVIERCLNEERAKDAYGDRCYGVVADPCRALPDGKSIAGATECFTREYRAWDDILNRTYRRLWTTLPRSLPARLENSQRAWVQSRKLTCEFFWDFIGRAQARPAVEECFGRETANRALYLQVFLNSKHSKL